MSGHRISVEPLDLNKLAQTKVSRDLTGGTDSSIAFRRYGIFLCDEECWRLTFIGGGGVVLGVGLRGRRWVGLRGRVAHGGHTASASPVRAAVLGGLGGLRRAGCVALQLKHIHQILLWS